MNEVGAEVVLSPTAIVAGGDALARDDDGRVTLVRGALPGERVRARIDRVARRHAHAVTTDVLDAAPGRVAPPCPYVGHGCGGCGWQHVAPDHQRTLKVEILRDALTRIGRVADPAFGPTVALDDTAYRTTVRVLVVDGRPAFRRPASHDPVPIGSCLVTHPRLDELLRDGRFDGAQEAELRAGARTGERLVLAHPHARDLTLPDDVVRVGSDDLAAGRDGAHHEVVGGRRWRISARSFFQVRPDGADALVELVRDAVGSRSPVIDLYAGVGLFAGTLGPDGRQVTAVEGNRHAVADARHNLADLAVRVVRADVAGYRPGRAAAVVADPSRNGLRAAGVATVTAARPERVVLVSCDAAALARDVALLGDAGFTLTTVTPVDLFPHTPHVEAVAVLDRSGPAS